MSANQLLQLTAEQTGVILTLVLPQKFCLKFKVSLSPCSAATELRRYVAAQVI